VTAAAAALLAMSCDSAPTAYVHAHRVPATSVELTRVQACERLRSDVRHNRGIPDLQVLKAIADHVNDPRVAGDARTAVRDIGHTGSAPVAITLLRDDCARAGVRVPPG